MFYIPKFHIKTLMQGEENFMTDLDWRIIVTMYEQKNVTDTAALLFMSQPTLTKRLQKIEAELGITLAVRNKKGVTFTPEGEYLASQAVKIMNLLKETKDGLSAIKGNKESIIKIGATNAFSRFFLPTILQKIKEVDKNIDFEITTDYSHKISKAVEHNKLDIGFIFGDIPFNGHKYHLGVNHAVLVCSKPFTLKDLPNMKRIDYSKDAFTQNLIDCWWREHFNSPPRVSMTATNGDTCREMVVNGLGYAIFTVEEFVANDNRLYKVPMTNLDGSPFVRNLWMIYKEDYAKNKTLYNFVNIIKDDKH
jgi:DNA-binding transcriptional LysR family regulator